MKSSKVEENKRPLLELKPLMEKGKLVKQIDKVRKGFDVKQDELAAAAEVSQSEVSKILSQERSISYDQLKSLVDFLRERYSLVGGRIIREYSSFPVKRIYKDQRLCEAAAVMFGGGYSQLAVLDRQSGRPEGIITDEGILEQLVMVPSKRTRKNWIRELSDSSVDKAGLIEEVPIIPANQSLEMASRVLVYHYACLVQDGPNLGIITRSDFLKLLLRTDAGRPAKS